MRCLRPFCAWTGGPGLGALVWGPWFGGPGLGALVWGPWFGDPVLAVRLGGFCQGSSVDWGPGMRISFWLFCLRDRCWGSRFSLASGALTPGV